MESSSLWLAAGAAATFLILGILGAGKKNPRRSSGQAAGGNEPNGSDSKLFLRGSGGFHVEAVGESHYQAALRGVVGKRGEVAFDCEAQLICEEGNPHDANAVQVAINFETVGYLSRGEAVRYRKSLSKLGHAGKTAYCNARIYGGGRKKYGVWLDIG